MPPDSTLPSIVHDCTTPIRANVSGQWPTVASRAVGEGQVGGGIAGLPPECDNPNGSARRSYHVMDREQPLIDREGMLSLCRFLRALASQICEEADATR